MELENTERNPFRDYRHTASVVGPSAFVCALLVLLAAVQPAVPGEIDRWVWCAGGIVGAAVALWAIGRRVVREQARRGNPHCATRIGQRYMLLIFVSAGMGVLGTVGLVAGVLSRWILLSFSVLLPGMVAAAAIALIGAGIVWYVVGKRSAE